ncbi:unnamed protein product [Orchesella dallaii]|uniref:BTB domain-containing protein n=1 Tax=Orchesella dallaii TaxID=48710 RepID=A0ABP1R392_9HEXA
MNQKSTMTLEMRRAELLKEVEAALAEMHEFDDSDESEEEDCEEPIPNLKMATSDPDIDSLLIPQVKCDSIFSITAVPAQSLPSTDFEHLDWEQLNLDSTESRILHLVENYDVPGSEFHDVEFHVGKEKVVVRSSKFLLSVRLEFFQDMFSQRTRVENDNQDDIEWKAEDELDKGLGTVWKPTVIDYPTLDPTVFKQVLYFLCRGEPHDFKDKDKDVDYIFDVRKIATHINYQELLKQCKATLDSISLGTMEEACRTIDRTFCDTNPDEMELNRCFSYVRRFGGSLIWSEEFLTMSQESILNILKVDLLKEDEPTIFRAVLRWAKHKIGLTKPEISDVDGVKLRDALGSIINEIRFTSMTAEQIVDLVKSAKVLSSGEVVDLILYIKGMPCVPTPFQTRPRVPASDFLSNRSLVFW